MVKIRLMRVGAKKNPQYRIVVVDQRKKRTGGYIESLGFFNPTRSNAEPLKIDQERAEYWLSQGAQPTSTALKLLEEVGVTVGKVRVKRNPGYRKRQEAAQAS